MTTLHKRNQERTHEENQERAYIAASHRGFTDRAYFRGHIVVLTFGQEIVIEDFSALVDRSMEARIESARKASEIHKKRTGKALRITPEDVRNEEMYQEVDNEEHEKLEHFHRDVIGEPPRPQGRGAHLAYDQHK
ncbi:2215_t:CDS:2 [Acaulospora morrowiae]|uniref:2215_t:CDS:1 n=1 Tax=Acaulospora morrowiae TaxID=94023 RepID=A0A9N9EPZ5_9GLOM|nr:2215_t:CDS:2 [Acaulospora morrowiae]